MTLCSIDFLHKSPQTSSKLPLFLHQYATHVILSSGRFAIISFQMCETFGSIMLLAFERLQKSLSKSLFQAFSL